MVHVLSFYDAALVALHGLPSMSWLYFAAHVHCRIGLYLQARRGRFAMRTYLSNVLKDYPTTPLVKPTAADIYELVNCVCSLQLRHSSKDENPTPWFDSDVMLL